MTSIENEVKSNILALFNASDRTTDDEYTIFGMIIKDRAIEYSVTLSYNYITELIGSTKAELAANRNKVVTCATDMTALRVWATLGGISIPTHFNYKNSEVTITKNVTPIIEANIELYMKSIKQWIRLLLSDTWVAVEEQDDLTFTSPIYDDYLGIDSITYDANIV